MLVVSGRVDQPLGSPKARGDAKRNAADNAPRQERSSATKPAALAALRMAALARQRPTKVFASVEASSMKAGVGARLAER
eukprot:15458606-Alexandrium_andersonii.AAC.1